jgi:uncharacterized membrane protein
MNANVDVRRSALGAAIFAIFDPLPFGFFVATLIFDVVYFRTGVILWGKGAAWLVSIGLVLAIVPRLINLTQVWITSRRWATATDRLDFWLNLVAIVVAIFNAFVHTRDAYGTMPSGMWLSALTVALLCISHGLVAAHSVRQGYGHV